MNEKERASANWSDMEAYVKKLEARIEELEVSDIHLKWVSAIKCIRKLSARVKELEAQWNPDEGCFDDGAVHEALDRLTVHMKTKKERDNE